MDVNGYALELLAREQLATLRAAAAAHQLARAGAARRPLRVALGRALVNLGRAVGGGLEGPRQPATIGEPRHGRTAP